MSDSAPPNRAVIYMLTAGHTGQPQYRMSAVQVMRAYSTFEDAIAGAYSIWDSELRVNYGPPSPVQLLLDDKETRIGTIFALANRAGTVDWTRGQGGDMQLLVDRVWFEGEDVERQLHSIASSHDPERPRYSVSCVDSAVAENIAAGTGRHQLLSEAVAGAYHFWETAMRENYGPPERFALEAEVLESTDLLFALAALGSATALVIIRRLPPDQHTERVAWEEEEEEEGFEPGGEHDGKPDEEDVEGEHLGAEDGSVSLRDEMSDESNGDDDGSRRTRGDKIWKGTSFMGMKF